MQGRLSYGVLPPVSSYRLLTLTTKREASLSSAISRGIREAGNRSSKLGGSSSKRDEVGNRRGAVAHERISRIDFARKNTVNDGDHHVSKRPQRNQRKKEILDEAPASKPYTTAGSEFLYGTFSVKSALEAGRRKLHKLYVWRGQSAADDDHDRSVLSLARNKGVSMQLVAGSWDKMLLKMSNQRPHNGLILEASPIPKLPVSSLKAMDISTADLHVQTATQSLEDEMVNSIFRITEGRSAIPRSGDRKRYPLLLWLDRITDTGNLGAIMRSAYFMGVDAIIIPEHGTAPLSPVTVKASAGAAELLPILIVKHEIEFIRMSRENGWKFIAAVAPNSTSTWQRLSQQGSFVADTALDSHPCVLMVGNEGEGLRLNMQKAADNFVSIRGARGPADGIESLNVSVAAALLVARMTTKITASRHREIPARVRADDQGDDKDSALF